MTEEAVSLTSTAEQSTTSASWSYFQLLFQRTVIFEPIQRLYYHQYTNTGKNGNVNLPCAGSLAHQQVFGKQFMI